MEKHLPSEDGEALPCVSADTNQAFGANLEAELRADSSPANWFAVYTISRHEKRVAAHFELKRIQFYLPTYRTQRRWQDGSKVELELPLFPAYVFVRITRSERVRVLESPGVVSIVSAGHEPLPLADTEIEKLRAGLHLRRPEPHPYLVAGERVRIKSGPLAGFEGVLLRRKHDFRVVITLDRVMQSMAVEVDMDEVETTAAAPSSHLPC